MHRHIIVSLEPLEYFESGAKWPDPPAPRAINGSRCPLKERRQPHVNLSGRRTAASAVFLVFPVPRTAPGMMQI
jgi:hypothetical protein